MYYAKKKRKTKVVKKLLPIFEGKRLNKRLAIQYSTFFFLRRYMMMFLFVFFPEMTMTQININLLLTLLMLLFIIDVYPFEEMKMNKQEMFNEICVLISGYVMLLYTEFVGDLETRYTIGWF